jgi:hypothetical protein
VTIRMCGYPPFGAQLILNGHEWVERQARRKCLTAVKEGNCFVEGSDFAAVNRVAARLHQDNAIGRLRSLCERWIYSTCLCFALTHEEQKRIGFAQNGDARGSRWSRPWRRGAMTSRCSR